MLCIAIALVLSGIARYGMLNNAAPVADPLNALGINVSASGLAVGIPAGILDIGTFADLANIGTLFAFIIVSAGVIILRRTQPESPRGFRVPGGSWLPLISIAFCLVLMMALPLETWVRFFVWLLIGFAIYFPFGRKHSALARG